MSFDESYYTTGNYRNYLSRKFDQQAEDLCRVLNLAPFNSILDFGCALGGLVAAFRNRGFPFVFGTDVSVWAINEGRRRYGLGPNVLMHYNRQLLEQHHDIVLFLDVLEHMPVEELGDVLSLIRAEIVVVRAPVSNNEGENFVLEVSRNDKTHIQCHDKHWWGRLFAKHGLDFAVVLQEPSIYESQGVLARVYRK